MQFTLDRAYLGCYYLPFTQPIPVPDFSYQLGFLVTKILGGNSHSIFPLIKEKNSLSPHICHIRYGDEGEFFRHDATHMRQP
jgi:hypothetical protein